MPMSGSSGEAQASFEGIRHHQTAGLIEVLRDTLWTDTLFVQRRYREKATGFPESLQFLASIQAVKAVDDKLTITEYFTHLERDRSLGVSGAILRLLLGVDTPYRREVFAYIRQFSILGGSVVYKPTVRLRTAESAVRNYLIDLGIVSYDSAASCYRLAQEHSSLYASAQEGFKATPPSELKRRLEAQEALGWRVEQEIMRFERHRVGRRLEKQVKQISVRDVAAGYDVLSVTRCEDGATVPRYIEVKAVSANDFQFFWTANEVAMAKLFGSWYYLYLVPIVSGGRVDVDNLQVIADPYKVVLGSGSKWFVETGVMKCSLESENHDDDLSDKVKQ